MQVVNLVLPLFALILIGYVSAKVSKQSESALGWMNFFIVYVVLPALFFQLIRKAPIESLANLRFIAASSGATVCIFIVSFFLGRWVFRSSFSVASLQAVAGSYSNIGYMGPALTLAALGQDALVPTILVFCVDNAFLFIVTPMLMAIAQRSGEQNVFVFIVQVLRRVVLHPFILATLLGIAAAVTDLAVPKAVDTVLDMLKNCAAPAALFTMGVVIAHRKVAVSSLDVPALLLIKLVLHPLLVYGLMQWLGPFDPVWMYTAVLMASLPPALNIYVLASSYQTYVQEASSIVLVGTVLAILTLTSVLYLIEHGLI